MKKIISLLITLIVLSLLAWLVVSNLEPTESPEETSTNPIEEEIPDLNPTENTNPFGESYTNPFE